MPSSAVLLQRSMAPRLLSATLTPRRWLAVVGSASALCQARPHPVVKTASSTTSASSSSSSSSSVASTESSSASLSSSSSSSASGPFVPGLHLRVPRLWQFSVWRNFPPAAQRDYHQGYSNPRAASSDPIFRLRHWLTSIPPVVQVYIFVFGALNIFLLGFVGGKLESLKEQLKKVRADTLELARISEQGEELPPNQQQPRDEQQNQQQQQPVQLSPRVTKLLTEAKIKKDQKNVTDTMLAIPLFTAEDVRVAVTDFPVASFNRILWFLQSKPSVASTATTTSPSSSADSPSNAAANSDNPSSTSSHSSPSSPSSSSSSSTPIVGKQFSKLSHDELLALADGIKIDEEASLGAYLAVTMKVLRESVVITAFWSIFFTWVVLRQRAAWRGSGLWYQPPKISPRWWEQATDANWRPRK